MSAFVSQSICTLRARAVNIFGSDCINIHIIDENSTAKSVCSERNFSRDIFLLLEHCITASRDGVMVDGALLFIRLNTIVADRPEKRSFFCLKAVGSYKDCSMCLVPTRMCISEDSDDGNDNSSESLQHSPRINHEDPIYSRKINGPEGRYRNPVRTVSAQLIIADAKRQNNVFGKNLLRNNSPQRKDFLARSSALSILRLFPPCTSWK